MLKNIYVLIVAGVLGLSLSACTEVTEFFVSSGENATCAAVDTEFGLGDDLVCVECNSNGPSNAKAEACGWTLAVRCNSNLTDDVYGVAVAAIPISSGSFTTATAYVDSDGTPGPSSDDDFLCHSQSATALPKNEGKCTTALKGNGKTATTFEHEIKYDPAKDDCT